MNQDKEKNVDFNDNKCCQDQITNFLRLRTTRSSSINCTNKKYLCCLYNISNDICVKITVIIITQTMR